MKECHLWSKPEKISHSLPKAKTGIRFRPVSDAFVGFIKSPYGTERFRAERHVAGFEILDFSFVDAVCFRGQYVKRSSHGNDPWLVVVDEAPVVELPELLMLK